MQKRGSSRIIAILLSVFILTSSIGVSVSAVTEQNTVEEQLYSSTALNNWSSFDAEDGFSVDLSSASVEGKKSSGSVVVLKSDESMAFDVDIQSEGEYRVFIKYRNIDNISATDSRLQLGVDGKTIGEVSLAVLWADKERHIIDRLGNETVPQQQSVSEYFGSYLQDYANINKRDFMLELSAGIHTFIIKSLVHSFEISEIYFVPVKSAVSYGEYISKYKDVGKSVEPLEIEAEEYSLKSDSYIRGDNVQKNNISPYEELKKKINILSGDSWNTPGQKVLWEINIQKTGLYRVALNYKQSSSANVPIFRTIEIDGEVPFSEWENYSFANTGNHYKTESLKAGENEAWIYLEKGTHTIALSVTIGYLQETYEELLSLVSEMNEYGSVLKKLAAGSEDSNRTWDMESYMPTAKEDICAFAERIDKIYNKLSELSSEEPTYADDLKYASSQLTKMAKKENKIPNNTEMLCLGDSSATSYLISVMSKMTEQSLSIDKFCFYGEDEPEFKEYSIIRSIWNSIKRFLYSFTTGAIEEDYGSTDSKDSDELVVWSGDSLLGVSILQQLLDETYNKENGTNIRIVRLQSDDRLVLSNAVGNNPDVVIQAGVGIPFEYAIRGAAKNLLEYDDFLKYYTSMYSIESLVSMYCDEGVFGAVESRDFSVMFYRKDILNSLELDVPNTWDDIKQMMPTLLRNSMNISHPLSGSGSYSISAAGSFVYQNGGNLYSADGSQVELDSEQTVSGLTEMTEMFTIYGAQKSVASAFNSFRYGQIPIVFGGFGMYWQLSKAAPELVGLWDIAPMPGTLQEDGSIARSFACNTSACMIFDNTDKEEEAWNFLKWWLSSDTQAEYSRRRQTGYGMQYLWNTANEKAFDSLPFTAEQKAVIKTQFASQYEIVNHPASYLVAREIGNVWNNVVISNKTLIDCINDAVILSNREIKRKLQEFGYMDDDGNLIKDYTTDALARLKKMTEEQQ